MTQNDDDNSSINDEDIVGKFVVHDKKLRFENCDDERSKSQDLRSPCPKFC